MLWDSTYMFNCLLFIEYIVGCYFKNLEEVEICLGKDGRKDIIWISF